ncbi:hypothetical protein [Kitasatospora sp. NPDC056181]|uniref:hypothetical protein n=1 Tax=Kitasatospora sp. NPDC056181 TaxID=3345737 RepID=UPI0035D97EC6
MSSGSFRIDLAEVEAAARRIRAFVQELEPHAAKVEAAARRVSPASCGTDPVGRALGGGGTESGGLIECQEQALQGVRRYLRNSGTMAENLLLMCRHYREAEGSHAAGLKELLAGSAAPLPAVLEAAPDGRGPSTSARPGASPAGAAGTADV